MALFPVPAAQRDAGFVSWFSCTLVSDKKKLPGSMGMFRVPV